MSKQFWQIASTAGFLVLARANLMASPITYTVSVNTSALNGTSGFLDFDFAPGNGSQSALVSISDFSSTGSLSGLPQVNGAVSGSLPGPLSIGNSTQFNDYFQEFIYGTNISFQLAFGGPALSNPNGTSTAGSTFAFAMFDALGSNPLLTDDPNGNSFIVEVNLDGGTTVTAYPTASGGTPAATLTAAGVPVPEPSTSLIMFLVALGLGAWRGKARPTPSGRRWD